MPPFSAAPRRTGTAGAWQFRDFTGRAYSSSFDVSAAATPAELDAVNVGIGNMSNSRLMERRITDFQVQINPANPLNTTFDEAYATIDDVLFLVFQNNITGEPRYVGVPAPDAIFFAPDGETVIAPDAAGAAGSGGLLLSQAITALETAMGAGWVYARGYKQGIGRRQRQPLPLAEPTGNPGDAPGL